MSGLLRGQASHVQPYPHGIQTDPAKVAAIRALRAKGVGITSISRQLGVGAGAVIRVTAGA